VIIDSQVHVWDASRYPDVDPHEGDTFYDVLDADRLIGEMDRCGVDRALLVPTGRAPVNFDPADALAAARRRPDRFRVVAAVDLADETAAEKTANALDDPLIVGIRAVAQGADVASVLMGPAAARYWQFAEQQQVPTMVRAPGAFGELAEIARRHPSLPLALDHFGLGSKDREAEIERLVPAMIRLATLPNISIKASSLPAQVSDGYPFQSVHRHVRAVVTAFGADRVFWGSDLSRLPCPYAEVVDLFRRELDLTADERASVLGLSVARWVGWATA
jgi:L-fuconolactonase